MFGFSRMESKMRRTRKKLRARFPDCHVSVQVTFWAYRGFPDKARFSVCILPVATTGAAWFGAGDSLEAASANAVAEAMEAQADAK